MKKTIIALLNLLLLGTPAARGQLFYTQNGSSFVVTGYSGGGAVTIPSTFDGLPVTSIGPNAFEYTGVTSVTIGSNVTSIESGAFWECGELTNVIIPNGVTSIEDHAFGFCTNLANYLASFIIPNTVTNIGDDAFYSCDSLTSVTIGNSTTNIGDEAFAGCDRLTAITVGGANPCYTSLAGVLFNESQTILIQCPGGKSGSYTVPNSVTNIGDYSFAYSQSLTSVVIGTNVTSIGEEAFYYFNMPTSILIPNSVTSIGQAAFEFCLGLSNVTIGSGVTNIGDEAFAVCLGMTSVYFEGNAPSLGASVFGSDNATAYYFPGTSGWSNPFAGLPTEILNAPNPDGSLQVTIYPTGVISNGAQWQVDGGLLQPSGATVLGLTVGNHIVTFTTVSDWTTPFSQTVLVSANSTAAASCVYTEETQFEFGWITNVDNTITITNYTGLGGSVVIPTYINGLTVTGIGNKAFLNITSLTSVAIPGSVTSIGDYAFADCTSLAYITIPSSVTNMGDYAFETTSLTDVTIPNSVISIGDGIFAYCSSLTSVTIGSNVTSIGDYTFYECRSLPSATIPASVSSIGQGAFENCGKLTSVTILGSIASIGGSAFEECTSLTSITVPISVSNIGEYAFAYCAGLTSVYFQGNAPSVGSFGFASDNPTLYYLSGSSGWSNPFTYSPYSSSLVAVLWNPVIQASSLTFGVGTNKFGFNITATNNFTIVVEACTNLASPVWVPLQTVMLNSGSFYFSDPQWTSYSSRFYRLAMP